MQRPPIQFDLPPVSYPRQEPAAEPPLPRMKWVWILFATFFVLLISSSLYKNDKKVSTLKDAAKMEERALEIQLDIKSLKNSLPTETSTTKTPMFEQQVDDLLDRARTESTAQKLRIVLRTEDNEKPFLDDIRNLAKSKSKEDQAFAKLYAEPRPSKSDSLELLKQLDKSEISERIATVQVKESFGDKDIRAKTFKPEAVSGMMVFVALAMVGFMAGIGLWLYYFLQRQSGKMAPKGLPMGNIDWGRADRLLFVSILVIITYVVSSTAFAVFAGKGMMKFEFLVFIPIFLVLAICMRVPIFGWRITPDKMGLSLKELPKHIGMAFAAFLANIPVLAAMVIVMAGLMRFLPGGSHPVSEELLGNPSASQLVNIFFLACVVAPIWEEIYFRGLLFPAFTKALGRPLYGALLSSFIFASIHPQGLAGVPVLMGIALMLCAVSYQTKSLVSNIILHGLHNGATLLFAILIAPMLR